MTKRASEAAFGLALREIDRDIPTYVYKPPDPKMGAGVSNWKPCDFMVWSLAQSQRVDDLLHIPDSAWFEVKDVDAVNTFNAKGELRDSQRQGIRQARRIGIPYWVAVYWRRHKSWTISDAVKMDLANALDGSVTRDLLQTRYGIESKPRELPSMLKMLLAGEV
jgi:hypothetical protein